MTDRERFEAWAVSEHFAVHRNGGEQYVNTATHHAWTGWQASRKQALEEAVEAIDVQCFGRPSANNLQRCLNAGMVGAAALVWRLANPEGEQG